MQKLKINVFQLCFVTRGRIYFWDLLSFQTSFLADDLADLHRPSVIERVSPTSAICCQCVGLKNGTLPSRNNIIIHNIIIRFNKYTLLCKILVPVLWLSTTDEDIKMNSYTPKAGRGCLMYLSCLESQGCHLISISFLLSSFFYLYSCCSFCLVLLLLMVSR